MKYAFGILLILTMGFADPVLSFSQIVYPSVAMTQKEVDDFFADDQSVISQTSYRFGRKVNTGGVDELKVVHVFIDIYHSSRNILRSTGFVFMTTADKYSFSCFDAEDMTCSQERIELVYLSNPADKDAEKSQTSLDDFIVLGNEIEENKLEEVLHLAEKIRTVSVKETFRIDDMVFIVEDTDIGFLPNFQDLTELQISRIEAVRRKMQEPAGFAIHFCEKEGFGCGGSADLIVYITYLADNKISVGLSIIEH